MKNVNGILLPEHGLQVEETLAAGDKDGAQRLFNYWFAWLVARSRDDQRIWDLGCGSGFGSRILAEESPAKVIGVDRSRDATLLAWRDWEGLENLSFATFDLENHWEECPDLKLAPDLVVALDLLEHIHHRDFFLVQLASSLPPDGAVLFSVPTAGRAKCHASPAGAAFHFNRLRLWQLLKRFFREVRLTADRDLDRLDRPEPYWSYAEQFKQSPASVDFQPGEDLVLCTYPIQF